MYGVGEHGVSAMDSRIRITLLMLLHVFAYGSEAQEDIRFSQVLSSSGQLWSTITTIAKDARGFYWLGTDDGVLRFDGTEVAAYRASRTDTASINAGVVWSLMPDTDGTLWIGTDQGLCRLDPRTGKARRFFHTDSDPRSVPQHSRTIVLRDPRGTLYAFGSGGIARIDGNSGRFTLLHDGVGIDRGVSDGLVARDGTFWLATGEGVVHADLRSGSLKLMGKASTDRWSAQHLAQDAEGRIWCAFWGGGIGRWDPERGSFVRYRYEPDAANPSNSNIFHWVLPVEQAGHTRIIACSPRGLLVATPGNGEEALTDIRWYDHLQAGESSLLPSDVRCALQEPDGQLWAGGLGGLSVAEPSQQRFARIPDAATGPIQRIRAFGDTLLLPCWYGEGLSAVINGERVLWPLPAHMPQRAEHAQMSDALRLADGTIRIASLGGLMTLDPRTGVYTWYEEQDPRAVRMVSLYQDREGALWCGGYGARVIRSDLRTGAVSSFGPGDGVGTHVSRMLAHGSGRIAMADQGGLTWWDPAHDHFTHEGAVPIGTKILSIPEANDLCGDGRGGLWIATNDGLFHRDPQERWALWGLENGLPQRGVAAVCIDAMGNAYALTASGLTIITPEGKQHDIALHPGMHAELGSSIVALQDGRLAFSSGRDLYRFRPEELLPRTSADLIPVITSITVNDTIAPLTGERTFDHAHDRISFTYTAPHFPDPGTHFRYMLVGADRDWNVDHGTRKVNYAGLAPGDYTFKVGLVDGSKLATWSFRIRPPWWRETWFLASVLATSIAVIVLVVRRESQRKLRERILVLEKQRAVEQERQRISQDMHDDLGSGLTRIAILSEVAKQRPDTDQRVLDEVSESARALVANLSNIVWVLDPEHDRLTSLAAYVREYAGKVLDQAGISLTAEIPALSHDRALPETFRREVFLIVKEALHNVVKHAHARAVRITLTQEDGMLCITVKDDGHGFEQGRAFGNGLRNMRQRAERIAGTLDVQSGKGLGTAVRLHAPLPGDIA